MLGKKQRESNKNFLNTWRDIKNIISFQEVESLIYKTSREMRAVLDGKNFGAAWSGGKDSVVVDFLLRRAYMHDFPSCIGMTDELEYPEFMQFVTDNMPANLNVYNSGHTFEWLSNNLDWLFPSDSTKAKRWFIAIQHKAQNNFFKDKNLDVLVTGRRLKDSNYVGKNGIYKNKTTGVVRYSPIYKWSHEQVLGCMAYFNLPIAPFYHWPNGWVVGSGAWAARQWTGSIENAWAEVYRIDPTVVHRAADYIDSAKQFLSK